MVSTLFLSTLLLTYLFVYLSASVFLRRLPLDVTFALIEDALKKFGPINAISIIKSGPVSVQVIY